MARKLVRNLEALRACVCPRCGAALLRQPDATLSCEACHALAQDRLAGQAIAASVERATHFEPLRIAT